MLILVLLLELVSRLFWHMKYGAPLLSSHVLLYVFYPGLQAARERVIERDDSEYDVLIMGGSVLESGWSPAGRMLRQRLMSTLNRPVRIDNLAQSAHTSRDSLNKYRRLRDRDFDLVLVYNGINDARTNNAPPNLYKADYSHVAWYQSWNFLETHEKMLRILTFPFSIHFVLCRLAEKSKRLTSMNEPHEEWLAYGENIKTRAAFRSNISRILELAKAKGERVVLMSFAMHIPADYTLERFKRRELDYGKHAVPVEIWGNPFAVRKGVALHNSVIRALAIGDEAVLYVEQDDLIPKNGDHFDDVCHLTDKGSLQFVTNIMDALQDVL